MSDRSSIWYLVFSHKGFERTVDAGIYSLLYTVLLLLYSPSILYGLRTQYSTYTHLHYYSVPPYPHLRDQCPAERNSGLSKIP